MLYQQLSLFPLPQTQLSTLQEWGTFKDSLRAPIHGWFTYPAGFSCKAVESSLKSEQISHSQFVYDPFMGTGTTNIAAKVLGINSYGVESHPLIFRIAQTKLDWEIDKNDVINSLGRILKIVKSQIQGFDEKQTVKETESILRHEFPELVLKCYEGKKLLALMLIRNAIYAEKLSLVVTNFFLLGLISLLRQVSNVQTGWPYIAPKKQKLSSLNKDVLCEFNNQILKMIDDLDLVRNESGSKSVNTVHKIFNADSRNTIGLIDDESVDYVFTSPPYLNNFDYADRTRLELYFLGEAKTWRDISQNIRNKLITSATTQISRSDARYNISQDLYQQCPDVYQFLKTSINKLGDLRKTKGGKKSYDLLVAGYFNDMFLVVSDIFRVLKCQKKAVFILGDSAPYGIHIPTDELIGKIGLGIGFSDYKIDILRTRGEKWRNNPQRHNILLRESLITLTKK